MASKRPRKSASSASDASKDSISSSPPTQLSPKAPRRGSLSSSTKSASGPVSCTLPPTCNPPNPATVLPSSKEFEKHYSLYHTHVCTAPENKRHAASAREGICGKVFPDARLLDLHLSECHDPLIEVRRDRGERTFYCFVATCDHKFSAPKGRRLHLIDTHKYPKEYYFSVTAKGVGEILHRWGQGASLLRKEWKPRPGQPGSKEGEETAMEVEPTAPRSTSPRSSPASNSTATRKPSAAPSGQLSNGTDVKTSLASAAATSTTDKELDSLTSNLSSLSLVPPSIRFGRGGKAGGFRGRGGRHGTNQPKQSTDGQPSSSPTRALGDGKRPGRGQAVAFGVTSRQTQESQPLVKEVEMA